jgi:hypothetical protein
MRADSRIDTALADVKAGSAAIDDARCTVAELLEECSISDRDQMALQVMRDAMNLIIEKSNAVIGGLVRVQERQQP